jgi:hypothetical protein
MGIWSNVSTTEGNCLWVVLFNSLLGSTHPLLLEERAPVRQDPLSRRCVLIGEQRALPIRLELKSPSLSARLRLKETRSPEQQAWRQALCPQVMGRK